MNLRALGFLALVALAATALGQKQPTSKEAQAKMQEADRQIQRDLKPDPKLEALWKKSTLSRAQFAQRVGSAIKGMRNAGATWTAIFQTSEGRGQMNGFVMVQDPRFFRIDSLVIQRMPFTMTQAADGTGRQVRLGDRIYPPIPLGQQLASARIAPTEYASVFQNDFSRLMFQGFTDNRDPWPALLEGLAKSYTVSIEERTMRFQGKAYKSYRVRGRNAATKASFQIVVDGARFLPVTVRTDRVLNGKPWMTQWSARWDLNRRFTMQDFRVAQGNSR